MSSSPVSRTNESTIMRLLELNSYILVLVVKTMFFLKFNEISIDKVIGDKCGQIDLSHFFYMYEGFSIAGMNGSQ